jgi:hypothetical protein
MTIKEIIIEYLEIHKYDGLYNPDIECGCGVDDLISCSEPQENCMPAQKRNCTSCEENVDNECRYKNEYGVNYCYAPVEKER